MVVVEGRHLNLPQSSSHVSSLLFDPITLSLALMHSDSSFSLYPSLSPLSLSSPSLPPPQALISPPISSATFIHLQSPNRLLFLVSSPYLGGAAILLRFYILNNKNNSFTKPQVVCNQNHLKFDKNKSAVVFAVNHGVSVKLIGSINVFAMYSISNSKIWVFAVKMEEDGVDTDTIKLMKCGVIDCCARVFAVSVSFGFLILGEDNGVRVFPLRPLVKGRVKKHNHRAQKLNLGEQLVNSNVVISSNGHSEEKIDKHSNSAKLRPVKLRQDSREGGVCFVAFKNKGVECFNSTKISSKSAKAISIQLLSPNTFMILDSVGDLHLLCLSNPVPGSEIPCHMKQLTLPMKVQQLAILPDVSTRSQTVWISDGHNTVHTIVVTDVDTSFSESDKKDDDEKLMQISVIQAIFTSEKIQEIIPLAANAILILGQGGISAYAIS